MKTYLGVEVLDLGTRWRSVVTFTSRLLQPRGKRIRYPLDKRLFEPQCRSGNCGEETNLDKKLLLFLYECASRCVGIWLQLTQKWCGIFIIISLQICQSQYVELSIRRDGYVVSSSKDFLHVLNCLMWVRLYVMSDTNTILHSNN
jgi:hypothetical protein